MENNQLIEIKNKITEHGEKLKNLVINSTETFQIVTNMAQEAKKFKKIVKALMDPLVENSRVAWKKNVSERDDNYIDPLDGIIKLCDEKRDTYQVWLDSERKRLEDEFAEKQRKEQAKIAEAARKKIEALQAKMGDLPDQIKKFEAMLQDPDLSETERGIVNAMLTTKRSALEALNKKVETVQAKVEISTQASNVGIVVDNKPKVEGFSSRKTKKVEVTDMDLLVMAIVEGKIPSTVLNVDLTALSKEANRERDCKTCKVVCRDICPEVIIPGCRVLVERINRG